MSPGPSEPTDGDITHVIGAAAPTHQFVELIIHGTEFVSFLSSIFLPLIYLPLIVINGPEPGRSIVFIALLGLHILCLVLGHGYQPRQSDLAD